MQSPLDYLFKSERLGFRTWQESDIDLLHDVNSDEEVMKFFPSTIDKAGTAKFIERMIHQYEEKGFCYYAVDILDKSEFLGFIGLSWQTYTATFTPCADIGWRLKRNKWGKGYATEGALQCLAYAKSNLKLRTIYGIAPKINSRSEQVMIKIGMDKQYEFEHPLLTDHPALSKCILYKVNL